MKRQQSGQSFFEMLIAVLIVSLVLIALVGLATRSIALTTFSRNKTLANRYAQEVIEWMRGERDTDWALFRGRATTSNNWCMRTLAWSSQGVCGTNATIGTTGFTRDVTFILTGPNTVNATIVIRWVDGSGTHESRTSTRYTNWKGN